MKFIKNLLKETRLRKKLAEKESQKDMEIIKYIEKYQRKHSDVDVIYKGELFH